MEKEKEKGIENWSEAVEDLVDAGDVESAISLLESVVETLNPSDSASQLPLASALSDLANLYSSKGFSLKADHLLSRASVLKQLHHSNSPGEQVPKESKEDGAVKSTSVASRPAAEGSVQKRAAELPAQTSAGGGSSDEDWEAIADLEPDELLPTVSSDCSSGISNLKLEIAKCGTPKRRGRGTFSYAMLSIAAGAAAIAAERRGAGWHRYGG